MEFILPDIQLNIMLVIWMFGFRIFFTHTKKVVKGTVCTDSLTNIVFEL